MPSTRRRFLHATALGLPALAVAPRIVSAADGASAPASPPRLRILILGGTGFTGPHQVRYALARGHHVTLFNRGRQPHAWPGEVVELVGDRNTGDLKALEGGKWDVCIDNPTTLPFWVRDAGRVLHDRVKQYVFISTISVYASNDKAADESAPVVAYAGADPMAETQETIRGHLASLYGPLKAVSEQEAQRQFGDRTTVIRPGLIVGPGDDTDRFTYWPVRLARGGDVLAPGDGSDPVQFIDARDLAEWTIRMAETRTTGTFNATGPAPPLAMREMLAGVGAAVRSDAHLVWVPAGFLEAEKVSPWSDLPVWVPGQGESAGFARRDIGRALAAGLTFRPLATTAAQTLAWFREQPAERQAKLRAGLDPAREAAVLERWKAAAKERR
ncbi:MAG TPA: NAD-dependent epimerase/dehydratase family protein [Caldimonas sp.]|jgi:2'-hydroxyisoflavone reductase|nr:NAD-dependent epimerase/dehydratase family protein [Caldimonas sp.]HEX4233419.1 NAD-dependent epimerase/dehydratase family protein [Caldimonas sp.]